MKKIDPEMFIKMADCKAEIIIKDGDANLHCTGNDAGRMFATYTAVKGLANKLGKTFEETLDVLRGMNGEYRAEEAET